MYWAIGNRCCFQLLKLAALRRFFLQSVELCVVVVWPGGVSGLRCWECLCEGDVVPVLRVGGDELKLTAAYIFRVIYSRSHPKPREAT